jgi:ABC-type nitrate/sulfonate/bicarbonate transport system substrate-binding protein
MQALSKFRVAVAAIVSLAMVLLATQGPAAAQQKQDVSIGFSSASFATSGPRVADQLGLFAKYGLNGKFVILDGSTAALAGMISGSISLIVVGLPDFVTTYARNDSVVAVATVSAGYVTSMVVSKAFADKSGVSPNAPLNDRLKALEGHTIASVAATSAGTAPYKAAFKAAGANVSMTYMSQPAMQSALESGAIDGYTASAPFWAFPVAKGSAVLWINGPKGELPAETTPHMTGVMLTTRQYAKENPELIKKLRAILADLSKVVEDRPAEVKAAVAKLYPDLSSAQLDVLFATEASGWSTVPLTPQILAREISVVKAIGLPVPEAQKLDPAAMIAP